MWDRVVHLLLTDMQEARGGDYFPMTDEEREIESSLHAVCDTP